MTNKKIILYVLLSVVNILCSIHAMDKVSEVSPSNLPLDIKENLASKLVMQSSTLDEALKNLVSLLKTDKELHSIVSSQRFLHKFLRQYKDAQGKPIDLDKALVYYAIQGNGTFVKLLLRAALITADIPIDETQLTLATHSLIAAYNWPTTWLWPAIFTLISVDYPSIVHALLANGVNPNTVIDKKSGETILSWSVTLKKLPIIKLLLAHGANPYVKNNLNQSPFTKARKEGLTEIVKLFETNYKDMK